MCNSNTNMAILQYGDFITNSISFGPEGEYMDKMTKEYLRSEYDRFIGKLNIFLDLKGKGFYTNKRLIIRFPSGIHYSSEEIEGNSVEEYNVSLPGSSISYLIPFTYLKHTRPKEIQDMKDILHLFFHA